MYGRVARVIGALGLVGCIVVYVVHPGLLDLDKVGLFAFCVFLAYGQGLEFLKRLGPFIVLLLFYDSFRGLVPSLDHHVAYRFMPQADKFLFGSLPTVTLQRWLWHGHVSWYDYIFTGAYSLHFLLPVLLAVLVWKTRETHYVEVVATYVLVAMAGFLTFLVYPAAPPWLAAHYGYIPPITRINFNVWNSMGLHQVVTSYSNLSPNAVAAIPSLHSAYATLLVIFVGKLYGRKWAALAAIYPLLIWFGTVYTGEHYAIDEIIGVFYALAGYFAVQWAVKQGNRRRIELAKKK
jgi:hypothetical protein